MHFIVSVKYQSDLFITISSFIVDRQCVEFPVLFPLPDHPHRMRVVVDRPNAPDLGRNLRVDCGILRRRPNLVAGVQQKRRN